MNWNYNDFLTTELLTIANNIEYEGKILVSDELAFTKLKSFLPDTIYVVVKRLNNQITDETETQPLQILVFCEQNSLIQAQTIFDIFVNTHNWQTIETQTSGVFAKQEYDKPVVVSNFNDVGYGYRSVLTLTGNIFLIKNVLDVKELTITADTYTTTIKPLNFTWAYTMTPNTQQEKSDNISSSVKNVSVVTVGFTIPFTETNAVDSITKVMSGTDTGNKTFTISFTLKTGGTPISYDMKLTSANVTTTPTSIAGLQLGFIR